MSEFIVGGKIEESTPVKTFTVSVTFTDMVEKNPLGAAKKACEWLKEDASTMIYEVIDEDTDEKFQVDLDTDSVTTL